jgi:hypothetical protein
MCLEERAPRHRTPSAGRKACRLQDARNRRAAHMMAHVLQGALNAGVAPRRIVSGHPHHERTDARLQPDAARTGAAVGPLPCDQLPVPPKNGVGCHEGPDSAQQPTAQAMAEFREAPTLVVLKTQPPSFKTDLPHTILFAEKRDQVLVFTLSLSAQYR